MHSITDIPQSRADQFTNVILVVNDDDSLACVRVGLVGLGRIDLLALIVSALAWQVDIGSRAATDLDSTHAWPCDRLAKP